MNIQQIRDRYDPENDAHPVTWLEMQLAEELHKYQRNFEQLLFTLSNLTYRIEQLEIQNEKLREALI